MAVKQVLTVECSLALRVGTTEKGLWVVVQFMASGRCSVCHRQLDYSGKRSIPPMFSSGKHLFAARILAGMHTLSLLCFADAVGGGSVGDGKGNVQGCTGPTHGDGSCGGWV